MAVIGQAFAGLFLLIGVTVWYAGRALCIWFSGRPWRSDYTGRRLVRQSVRATFQTLLAVVVVGWLLAPAATIWVTTTIVGSLVVLAGGYRLRLWLDAREAAKPVVRAKVRVGEPIRPEEPPIDVEVLELPTRDRAATTRRLVRELEAAR